LLHIVVVKLSKQKQGFSMVEMLVSIGIVGVVITMFSNVLVSSLQTTIKISNRSAIREELSTVSSLIRRDLRTAEEIVDCANTADEAVTCRLLVNNEEVTWRACQSNANQLCKMDQSNNVIYRTPAIFKLEKIEFASGFEEVGGAGAQRSILLTIVASHTNPRLNISNLVFQTTLSSRNYDFTFSIQSTRPTVPPATSIPRCPGNAGSCSNKLAGDDCGATTAAAGTVPGLCNISGNSCTCVPNPTPCTDGDSICRGRTTGSSCQIGEGTGAIPGICTGTLIGTNQASCGCQATQVTCTSSANGQTSISCIGKVTGSTCSRVTGGNGICNNVGSGACTCD
jgi:prepilin-type N-terminal cleavage/methylation domain-containing protein